MCKDFIHDMLEWLTGVYCYAALGYVGFGLIQSRNEFPLFCGSTEISWIHNHTLTNAMVHRVLVNIKHKHTIQ